MSLTVSRVSPSPSPPAPSPSPSSSTSSDAAIELSLMMMIGRWSGRRGDEVLLLSFPAIGSFVPSAKALSSPELCAPCWLHRVALEGEFACEAGGP